MIHYLFRLNKNNLASFKKDITKKGLKHIYTIKETESPIWMLGGFSEVNLSPEDFTNAVLLEESSELTPNWEKQAELFSPYYSQGLIQLDLTPYGLQKMVSFYPGEGFGDLSHPTTKIMLELANPYIKGKTILDIGSGNGVLTIASSALGAKRAYGVEIDPLALGHSHKNLKLNCLDNISFHGPNELPLFPPDVILLNMITSEQEIASQFYPHLNARPLTLVTSGILDSQKDSYIAEASKKGWSLALEHEEDGWVGFVFQV